MSNLHQIAINAALSQNWSKAISANQDILKDDKEDINTLNRLAFAYTKFGKFEEAKKLYKKILGLDKYNIIAQKNLDKLNSIPKNLKASLKPSKSISGTFTIHPSLFIEEPGKTKTVVLINTAPASVLSHLNTGDPVFFYPKKHSVDVRTVDKVYLGALPDDFAFKLLRFIKAGYEYNIYIKNSTKNSVNIFIREVKRAKRYKSQPSFVPVSPAKLRSMQNGRKVSELDEDDENGNSSDHESLDE